MNLNLEPTALGGTATVPEWHRANAEARARGPVSAQELAAFVAFLSARLYTVSSSEYPACEVNWKEAVAEAGPKYARIVSRCPLKDERGRNYHQSAYCFIDLSNGDILKADGWKKPAKHPRGNIRVGSSPNWWNNAVTLNGAAYIR